MNTNLMNTNLMNKNELVRVVELAESKIFKNSENIRRIIFDNDYSSPLLEEVVSDMKVDLDVLIKASRQLSILTNPVPKEN